MYRVFARLRNFCSGGVPFRVRPAGGCYAPRAKDGAARHREGAWGLCRAGIAGPWSACQGTARVVQWPAPGSEDTELGSFWSRRWSIERKRYAREFKLEAVRLVKERGVSVAQAS